MGSHCCNYRVVNYQQPLALNPTINTVRMVYPEINLSHIVDPPK